MQTMENANHLIARAFFAALSNGKVPDELVTDDMTAWTTSNGKFDGAVYRGGISFLASIFSGGIAYTVNSLTAEEDRVAAEVQSRGTLINGETFEGTYVFLLRIRDGRIASIAEHFDPRLVEQKIMPLLQKVMVQKG